MTDTSEWTGRVGAAWADQWGRTDRSFGSLTDRLLDPQMLRDFRHALDIGCGAGELVARLAPAHPGARITGLDISAELVAVAQARCAAFANAEFNVGDAAAWCAPSDSRPDLFISRHGVMFFADPIAAFMHLRGEAAPGAALRFSCFRGREDNEWVTALASVLPAPASPPDRDAPGPFAFADSNRVEAILGAAGWREIAFEPVDYAMIAGEGANAVDEALAYFQRIGPAARAIAELPENERSAARERLRIQLSSCQAGSRVAFDAAAWIVTARAA